MATIRDDAAIADAEGALREFFAAFTQWELDQQLRSRLEDRRFIPSRLASAARALSFEELAAEHDRIAETYWTRRALGVGITHPFPVGRTGYGDPPLFHRSESLVFERAERTRANRVVLNAPETTAWPFHGPWRFVMVREAGRWRIDSISVIPREGKRARRFGFL